MDKLLMPDAPAGAGINRNQRIAEQVVALAIASVEVEPRAAQVDERNAALLVNGGLAPVVDAA